MIEEHGTKQKHAIANQRKVYRLQPVKKIINMMIKIFIKKHLKKLFQKNLMK